MTREEKLNKLTKLLMERLQVHEFPSVSEMNVYLDAADDGKLNQVLFSLYESRFVSMERQLQIYKCKSDKKAKCLKEIYLKVIHPED